MQGVIARKEIGTMKKPGCPTLKSQITTLIIPQTEREEADNKTPKCLIKWLPLADPDHERSDSNSVCSSYRAEGRTYSNAAREMHQPIITTSSQAATNQHSTYDTSKQPTVDRSERNHRHSEDALQHTRSDDQAY
jgi:hypothetical protein